MNSTYFCNAAECSGLANSEIEISEDHSCLLWDDVDQRSEEKSHLKTKNICLIQVLPTSQGLLKSKGRHIKLLAQSLNDFTPYRAFL